MMRQISLLMAAALGAIPAVADVKIQASYTSSGQTSQTTIYSNGNRLRYEYGSGLVLLRQCDLNRTVQLDDKAKSYSILPAEQAIAAGAQSAPSEAAKTEITDTNERKDMFGYPARHLKMAVTSEEKHERTETDGWYIDLKDVATCSREQGSAGTGGYPVAYTITSYAEPGKQGSTMEMRVNSLVAAPLEASLFEIPQGYSESKPQAETQKTAGKQAEAPHKDTGCNSAADANAKPASKLGGFLHKAPVLSSVAGGNGAPLNWKSAAMLASNVLPMTMAAKMLGGAFNPALNPAMMSSLMGGHGPGMAMMSMDPMMSSLSMFLRASSMLSAATPAQPQNAQPGGRPCGQ